MSRDNTYDTRVSIPVKIHYTREISVGALKYALHLAEAFTEYIDGLIVVSIAVEVYSTDFNYIEMLGELMLTCVIDNKISRFESYSVTSVEREFDTDAVYTAITTGDDAIRVSI